MHVALLDAFCIVSPLKVLVVDFEGEEVLEPLRTQNACKVDHVVFGGEVARRVVGSNHIVEQAGVILGEQLLEAHLRRRHILLQKEAADAKSESEEAFAPVNTADVNVKFGAFFRFDEGPEQFVGF